MTFEELESALRGSDDEARYRAIRGSGELDGHPGLLPALADALGDASWRVRKAVVDRMVEHPERGAVLEALIAAMADPENAGKRNAGAEALVRIGPGAVPALVRRLGTDDQDLRKFLVDALGDIGHSDASEALITRLADGDENVRAAAAEALGKIGGATAQQALVGVLGGSDLLLTVSALDALVRAGAEVPYDKVEPLLHQRLFRRPALKLLARLETDDALGGFVQGLRDPSQGTRESALAALGQWSERHDPGRDRVAQALAPEDRTGLIQACLTALDCGDSEVIAGSMDVLCALRADQHAPRIIAAAADERVRERAFSTVLRMGCGITGTLRTHLADMPAWAQVMAIRVLATCGDRQAVPDLVDRLEHPDPDVRLAAARGLAGLEDGRAVVPVARLLGRTDRLLAGTAIGVLRELAEPAREEVLEACRKLLGDDDALRVADACRVLSEVGSPAEIPLLQDVLRHEDPRAREAAALALGSLRSPEAVDQLRFALTDESPQVRAAAARALGQHGDRIAAEALLIALQDDEPTVAGAAAEAVGSLGHPEYGVHLLPLLGHAEHPGAAAAAWSAVRALARLQAPELPQALTRAASHPEGEVAKEAAAVARELEGEAGTQVLLACARHPAWDVRLAAARALARRADPRVLGDLQELLAREQDGLAAEGFAEAIRLLEGAGA